jgi:DNA-binding transcriptional regulator YhcF (GntR family)
MPKENQLQIESWSVITALIKRHFKLASLQELADDTELNIHKVRRIMQTWETLGLVEKRADLWRLSAYFSHTLPGELQLALADSFGEFIPKTD